MLLLVLVNEGGATGGKTSSHYGAAAAEIKHLLLLLSVVDTATTYIGRYVWSTICLYMLLAVASSSTDSEIALKRALLQIAARLVRVKVLIVVLSALTQSTCCSQCLSVYFLHAFPMVLSLGNASW